jgi:hypothetical protein
MSYEGQYNPKLVTATVAPPGVLGVPIPIPGLPQGFTFPYSITGRAADGFFTKARTVDSVTLVTGAEGNTSLVVNPDTSGNFAITLQHGTLGCRLLSILYSAQSLMGEGQIPPFTFSVTYRDNNQTPPETHAAFNCLIARSPDVSFGASLGTVVWGFVAASVVSNFSSRLGG